jgi:hypothetical protein
VCPHRDNQRIAPKMLVGNHKTNTAQGKLTENETTTIAMKFY